MRLCRSCRERLLGEEQSGVGLRLTLACGLAGGAGALLTGGLLPLFAGLTTGLLLDAFCQLCGSSDDVRDVEVTAENEQTDTPFWLLRRYEVGTDDPEDADLTLDATEAPWWDDENVTNPFGADAEPGASDVEIAPPADTTTHVRPAQQQMGGEAA